MLRFKLKYRFWGCVDTETEALTRGGWVSYDKLDAGDEILTLDPETDEIRWQPVESVNVYDYTGHMVEWDSRISAVSTPNHRWLVEEEHGSAKNGTLRYERAIARTEFDLDGDRAVVNMRDSSRLVVGGGTPMAFADQPKWTDEAVETLAWYVTEGWDHVNQNGTRSIYLAQKKPEYLGRIRRLAAWWKSAPATFTEYAPKADGVVTFYLGSGVKEVLWLMAPNKAITPEFLCSLTYSQAKLFYDTLLDGDGCHTHGSKKTTRWTQKDPGRQAGFQMLCAMLGKRTALTNCGEKVQEYASRFLLAKTVKESQRRVYLEDGKIWCPTVASGIWFARRRGSTYWTGNTTLDGTRQVFTYVELITSEIIEEYINDQLISSHPNPLGEIPIVHISNLPIASSPWGMSDIQDIIGLNRQYNETATNLADIVAYHAAPTTVIVGAKMSNLEKGARKVWANLPKDAQVYNLEMASDAALAQAFMTLLKQAMHEMTGIPVTALGQEQAVSNTSGVALQIQYQPMMMKFGEKSGTFGKGFAKINEYVLKTLALKEPELFVYDPSVSPPLKDGQLPILDLRDPNTYRTKAHFQTPLPIDRLIKLNEIMSMMQLGLESKRGALKELGSDSPDEKLQELESELMDDAKRQGALDLLRAEIQDLIMMQTISGGMAMGAPAPGAAPGAPPGGNVASAGGPDVNTAAGPSATNTQNGAPLPGVQPDANLEDLMAELSTLSQGTKLPQRRMPNSNDA